MNTTTQTTPLDTLIVHWAWDILYPLNGQKQFVGQHGFEHAGTAKLIGAEDWFDEEQDEFDPVAARRRLKESYRQWQENHRFEDVWQQGISDTLRGNLAQWEQRFGFSDTDCRVLAFSILLHTRADLARACTLLGEMNDSAVCGALAALLRLPESDIADALAPRGRLASIGLVSLDHDDEFYLRSKIDLLSHRFAELMVSLPVTPAEILKQHIQVAPQTELALDDFAHLGVLVPAAKNHLAHAFEHQARGCNILIHGVAGTGKTEFTRALSKALDVELYEISWTGNNDDRPADRFDRMNALRMAQNILAGQRTMLMFDEIEDLFDRGQSHFSLNKAWLNRMLENNAVPMVWVCNNVSLMDPSAVRRFDIVIEMKAPPATRRADMIAGYAESFLPKSKIRSLAEHEALVPALLKKAHKVTEHAAAGWDKEQKGDLFQKLLHNTLKAQGNIHALDSGARLPDLYDIRWINSRQDVDALGAGIARAGRGTLCLYGPPGTGKSAYAAWLAEQSGRRLIYKRGSDLLSKYVGETEALIAQAFEEARSEEAVLLFDEVDGFLQDRRSARQNWEVTQVNEMLTQMENYPGIFVATTNLMANLDQAALRRFDFKIEFSHLRHDQAWQLFQAHCAALGLDCPGSLKAELSRIRQLAPGDFATAERQARIIPFADAAALLEAVRRECSLKEGSQSAMGFV